MTAIKLVFMNGHFQAAASDLSQLPKAVRLHTQIEDALVLGESLAQQGMILHVPKDISIKQPIHCVFMTTEAHTLNHVKFELRLEERSHAVVFVEYLAKAESYETNENVFIHLAPDARLEFYKLQQEGQDATHVSHLQVEQQANSFMKTCHVARGARYARENIVSHLQESQANCSLLGLYFVDKDKQQSESYVRVNHNASYTGSEMHYKGIADNKSVGLFNGKIYVASGVHKVHAEQSNHNLLLSKEAEIKTKPEFEIYADDVKCKHGATVGQIDAEALFYLRSRGIDKETAQQLMTQAFVTSILDRITQPEIRAQLQRAMMTIADVDALPLVEPSL